MANDKCKILIQALSLLGLNLDNNISENLIKIAYRESAKKWHPDKYTNCSKEEKDISECRMKEINSAYTLLTNFIDEHGLEALLRLICNTYAINEAKIEYVHSSIFPMIKLQESTFFKVVTALKHYSAKELENNIKYYSDIVDGCSVLCKRILNQYGLYEKFFEHDFFKTTVTIFNVRSVREECYDYASIHDSCFYYEYIRNKFVALNIKRGQTIPVVLEESSQKNNLIHIKTLQGSYLGWLTTGHPWYKIYKPLIDQEILMYHHAEITVLERTDRFVACLKLFFKFKRKNIQLKEYIKIINNLTTHKILMQNILNEISISTYKNIEETPTISYLAEIYFNKKVFIHNAQRLCMLFYNFETKKIKYTCYDNVTINLEEMKELCDLSIATLCSFYLLEKKDILEYVIKNTTLNYRITKNVIAVLKFEKYKGSFSRAHIFFYKYDDNVAIYELSQTRENN